MAEHKRFQPVTASRIYASSSSYTVSSEVETAALCIDFKKAIKTNYSEVMYRYTFLFKVRVISPNHDANTEHNTTSNTIHFQSLCTFSMNFKLNSCKMGKYTHSTGFQCVTELVVQS